MLLKKQRCQKYNGVWSSANFRPFDEGLARCLHVAQNIQPVPLFTKVIVRLTTGFLEIDKKPPTR
jgi:hypothetical protein